MWGERDKDANESQKVSQISRAKYLSTIDSGQWQKYIIIGSVYIFAIFDLYIRYSICLDWFTLLKCVCVCCMWAAVFGIVFDVSANKFYHLFYSLLPIEYDMALSSGSSATQHGQTRHINTIQSTPYTLIGLESNSLTHTHAHPTTIYTLLSSAVNSYCLFCEFRSLIMCSLVWMAKWRT